VLIKSSQIKNDSVQGEDIKDGTIEFIDLAPEVVNRFNQIDVNARNILVNSAELRALKQQELNADLSIFVDSFDDEENLDPASFNYNLDPIGGFVELVQGGQLFIKDSSQGDFELGTFANTESFLDVGGDGALRKLVSVAGANIVLPNFPTGQTVTLDGVPVPTSIAIGTYVEGGESSAVGLNFDNLTNQQSIYEVSFTGLNISGLRFLSFFYLKKTPSALKYTLQLEDSASNTHNFPQRDFVTSAFFQKIEEDLNDAIGSVNLASINAIRILIDSVAADQSILSLFPVSGNSHMEVREDRTIKQVFSLTEDRVAQIVKIRVRWENDEPLAPLDIALANVFETTLATGQILPGDAGNSWQEFLVLLSNPVHLKKDVNYSVLIQSPASTGADGWDVGRTANNAFPQFQNFYNGSDTSYNLAVEIISSPVAETIFFDNLNATTTSTYTTGNQFQSRAINLGIVPDSLDDIFWAEEGGGMIRFLYEFVLLLLNLD
jgi:hypothetical protein